MTLERRRSARVKARKGSQGQLRSTVTIDILDLSVDGVRFELSSPLRPQAVYDFRTVIGDLTVATQLRITRCAAGGYRDDGRGGRLLNFKAGGEFVWTEPSARQALQEHLAEGKRKGGSSSSSSGILRLVT